MNHLAAPSCDNIFNLWRVVESEKDLYAKNVEEYFKKTYFSGKDLSAVSVSLVEAYYNIFDHANAGGNAFSMISYNPNKQILSYAVADFGFGIPNSVRKFLTSDITDIKAISWALQNHATVRSTFRNKGFGMTNFGSLYSPYIQRFRTGCHRK